MKITSSQGAAIILLLVVKVSLPIIIALVGASEFAGTAAGQPDLNDANSAGAQ